MAHSANDNHATVHDGEVSEGMFDQLPFAGQLLIWGMRHWVTALRNDGDFFAMTGDGFRQFGLGDAGKSIDDLFRVVATSATRQIDIRCVKCRHLSPDESLLLDCVAAGQQDRLSLSYAGLAEILPPAALRHVMPTLVALAKTFAQAGLLLRQSSTIANTLETAIATTRSLSIDRARIKLAQMDVSTLMH